MDCPICMETVASNKNMVITECGHCFHSSCLMKSVAHNGFGCPYCRTAMAEEVQDDDNSTDNTYIDEIIDDAEIANETMMRGFRFFWNIVNNEDIDEDDDADEEQEDEWFERARLNNFREEIPIPSVQYVADKLQNLGVSFNDMVQLILYRDHEEYENENETENDVIERLDGAIFGNIRVIVSNYNPEPI